MKYIISLIAYLLPAFSFAQDIAKIGTGSTGGAADSAGMESLLIQLGIIFVIFYFLLIRPQQKKFKSHTQMISQLKKGDKVITGAGFVGKVIKVEEGDKFLDVEIANGVEVKVLRSSITDLADKPVQTEKKNRK